MVTVKEYLKIIILVIYEFMILLDTGVQMYYTNFQFFSPELQDSKSGNFWMCNLSCFSNFQYFGLFLIFFISTYLT